MENRNAAGRYAAHVRRRLTCSVPARRRLSLRCRELADQYAEENPDARYDDFVTAFGSPGDFAGELLSTLDGTEVETAQKRRGAAYRIILVCLVLALCGSAVFGWSQWFKYEQYRELFDEVKDADMVIVQYGPQKITDEEYEAIRIEAQKQAANTVLP